MQLGKARQKNGWHVTFTCALSNAIVSRAVIVLGLVSLAGCGGVRDVTHNKRYEGMFRFLPNHTYRLTRDAALAPDGWLGELHINAQHPTPSPDHIVISAGTRFLIDKVILDDRVTSLQFHPLGVLLDGPYQGRRIDTILLGEDWATEDRQLR